MAYTTPLTAVSNAALTAAQWNASVRDNFQETGPAKATTAGRLIVTSGANTIVERAPTISRTTGGGQSTTSTSFTDLATIGPSVLLTCGAAAIWGVSAFIQNATGGGGGYMGCEVSGASAIAANASYSLRIMSGSAAENSKQSYVSMYTTLTPGSNLFRAKYATPTGGTATYDERELFVIPL